MPILIQTQKKDSVYSKLTGGNIPIKDFTNSQIIGKEGSLGSDKINNTWAVPYFGSVAKQNMNVEGFQNKLENFTGTSQFNFQSVKSLSELSIFKLLRLISTNCLRKFLIKENWLIYQHNEFLKLK